MGQPKYVDVYDVNGTLADTLSYTYTDNGLVRRIRTDDYTTYYTYDVFGRLIEEETGNISVRSTYSLLGDRTDRQVYQGSRRISDANYRYDANGRMTYAEDEGYVAEYTYDNLGNCTEVCYDDRVTERRTYNLAGYPESITHKRGTRTLYSFDYVYSVDGNMVEKHDDEGRSTYYTYDSMNRLIEEVEELDGDVVQTYEYAFDDFSNRTELIASGDEDYTVNYWYDANNRLLESEKDDGYTETVTEYSYDDNGNQVEKEVWIDNSFDSSETSVYNGFNQLVSVSNDNVDAEYTYAPSGLRHTKTVDNDQIYYVYDGDNVIAELYDDEVTAYYLRGLNLFGSFIGRDEYFYLYNAHGDVVNLTDTSGYIEHTYRYDAFGNEREPASSDNNPFRYCGEYYDGETGSYYLRARYYDPVIGRFTQEDNHWNNTNRIYDSEDAITVLVIQQSGNLYSYCVCNPLFFIDESGLNVVPFWGFIHSAVQSHIKMKHPTYFLEQKIAYKGTPFYGRADVISPDGQVWEIKSERILSDPEKRVAAEQQLIKYVNNEWVNGEVPLSVATSTLEGAFKLKTRYVNYNVEYHTIGGGLISYSYDYDFVEEQAVEDISTAVIIGGYIAVFLMSGGTIPIPGFAY